MSTNLKNEKCFDINNKLILDFFIIFIIFYWNILNILFGNDTAAGCIVTKF